MLEAVARQCVEMGRRVDDTDKGQRAGQDEAMVEIDAAKAKQTSAPAGFLAELALAFHKVSRAEIKT